MKYNFFKSPIHGIGCVAIKNIKKGEAISKEPYFVFTKDMIKYTESVLGDYYWNVNKKYLIVNGLGSFCNHSYNNNIMPHFRLNRNYVYFYALKDIKIGEELLNNYGKHYWEYKNRIDN